MISIKRFLEERLKSPAPEHDVTEALTQMVGLLLEGMTTHMVRGKETDFRSFRRNLNALARQMEEPQSAMTLLSFSSDAVEALETYCLSTTEYFREQNEERQTMVAMLTETVVTLSGQTDASVDRLHAIEKQVERASELDDIRTLRATLADSLSALREAAAEQRSKSAATIEQLQDQIATVRKNVPENAESSRTDYDEIDLAPELSEAPVETVSVSYVAAFRLQRAEHIASRFGESVKSQMLSTIATKLKTVLGPGDRLVRWKGNSIVMFIKSPAPIQAIRIRLRETVAGTGQQYVEVGRKSAMLSVGIDWIVFPQAEHRSLESVFTKVDAFLSNKRGDLPPIMTPG